MCVLPKDCDPRKVGTRARAIVVYKIDSNLWDWHEQTGTDHGTDLVFELVENNEWANRKIECQVKGTRNINRLLNGTIGFDLDIKTINYALSSSIAFLLVVVDINTEEAYFLPLQDHFIFHQEIFERLHNNTKTLRLHISMSNILCQETNEQLIALAQKAYVGGPDNTLHVAI